MAPLGDRALGSHTLHGGFLGLSEPRTGGWWRGGEPPRLLPKLFPPARRTRRRLLPRWPQGPRAAVCAPVVCRRSVGAPARTATRPLPARHQLWSLSRSQKRTGRAPVSPEPRHHRGPRARPQLTGRGRPDARAARGEAPAVLKLGAGTAASSASPAGPPPRGPLLPEPASWAVMSGAAEPRGRDRGSPPGAPRPPPRVQRKVQGRVRVAQRRAERRGEVGGSWTVPATELPPLLVHRARALGSRVLLWHPFSVSFINLARS